jgi:hypothetical protein
VPRRPPRPPPIRSGKRVVFSALDDGTGLVDLAFFGDSHDACARTVFRSWLLLVRGVVQRRVPCDELEPFRHHRALLSAAEEPGTRLRSLEKVCRTLTLTVRYADRSATTRSRTLAEATAHSSTLTGTAYRMYGALGLQRARVCVIALRVEGLTPRGRRPPVSSPSTRSTRRSAVSRRSPTGRGRSSART